MTIAALKQAAEQAVADHDAERDRLAALGLKSAERYLLLKPLKAAADQAHAAYAAAAKRGIHAELTRMIEADRPAREAAARARSTWKQAKHDAGIR